MMVTLVTVSHLSLSPTLFFSLSPTLSVATSSSQEKVGFSRPLSLSLSLSPRVSSFSPIFHSLAPRFLFFGPRFSFPISGCPILDAARYFGHLHQAQTSFMHTCSGRNTYNNNR